MAAKRWRGAMYISGYAVECLFKARLMEMYGCQNLVELEERLLDLGRMSIRHSVFTHQLALLLHLTGRGAVLQQNTATWQAFLLMNTWIPAWRYESQTASEAEARDFLAAVDAIMAWIKSNV